MSIDGTRSSFTQSNNYTLDTFEEMFELSTSDAKNVQRWKELKAIDDNNKTQSEKDDIIFYCKHDVYALHVLYYTTSKAYIDTKVSLCDTFGLTRKVAYTNTNANLSGKALQAERVHGTSVTDPTITIRNKEMKE